jgi:hypothetical protein
MEKKIFSWERKSMCIPHVRLPCCVFVFETSANNQTPKICVKFYVLILCQPAAVLNIHV